MSSSLMSGFQMIKKQKMREKKDMSPSYTLEVTSAEGGEAWNNERGYATMAACLLSAPP